MLSALHKSPLGQVAAELIVRHQNKRYRNMTINKTEPTKSIRFIGAIVAFAIFVAGLLAALTALEAAGVSRETLSAIGKAFTYFGVGILFIGWKWPYSVLKPFRKAVPISQSLGSTTGSPVEVMEVSNVAKYENPQGGKTGQALASPLQRALFAVSCVSLLPWLFMRVFRELWQSSDITEYLSNVFIAQISPWFESGWWLSSRLHWYDWLVLPAFAVLCLAFSWPHTGARILKWVQGSTHAR